MLDREQTRENIADHVRPGRTEDGNEPAHALTAAL
jgi:hypothetical protein